jgi:hypothetical protein
MLGTLATIYRCRRWVANVVGGVPQELPVNTRKYVSQDEDTMYNNIQGIRAKRFPNKKLWARDQSNTYWLCRNV